MQFAAGHGLQEAFRGALALGALAGTLGLATAAMGLPTTTSSATRKPKNWFQVAQVGSFPMMSMKFGWPMPTKKPSAMGRTFFLVSLLRAFLTE